jgi:hypothetical protein
MGIQKSGIIGPFRNKIGPAVGRRHMGQDLILPLPRITPRPATESQLEARQKLGLLNGFLSTIAMLVEPGFKAYVKHNTPVNAAFSYNYPHAFVKEEDELLLNYPKMVYSRGNIVTPEGVQLSSAGTEITFSWLNHKQSAYCQYTDVGSFLVYNPAKDQFSVAQAHVERRVESFSMVMGVKNRATACM